MLTHKPLPQWHNRPSLCMYFFKYSTMLISIVFMIGCGSQQRIKEEASHTTKPASPTHKPAASPQTVKLLDANAEKAYQDSLILLNTGDAHSALQILNPLAQEYTNHYGIQVNTATALYKKGELEEAQTYCENAININSKIAHAYNLQGLIQIEKKAFKNAESAYLKALSLDKDFPEAHYNLALMYDIYYQEINKAYRHYQKYLRLNPQDKLTKDWVEQLKYSLEQE